MPALNAGIFIYNAAAERRWLYFAVDPRQAFVFGHHRGLSHRFLKRVLQIVEFGVLEHYLYPADYHHVF